MKSLNSVSVVLAALLVSTLGLHGAKKLGEVAAGATPRFTATDLTPGYHVFSILATDGDGNVRTADPKLVIVGPPEDASTAGAPAAGAATSTSGINVVRWCTAWAAFRLSEQSR